MLFILTFTKTSRAALKAFEGCIRPVGRRLETPGIKYYSYLFSFLPYSHRVASTVMHLFKFFVSIVCTVIIHFIGQPVILNTVSIENTIHTHFPFLIHFIDQVVISSVLHNCTYTFWFIPKICYYGPIAELCQGVSWCKGAWFYLPHWLSYSLKGNEANARTPHKKINNSFFIPFQ